MSVLLNASKRHIYSQLRVTGRILFSGKIIGWWCYRFQCQWILCIRITAQLFHQEKYLIMVQCSCIEYLFVLLGESLWDKTFLFSSYVIRRTCFFASRLTSERNAMTQLRQVKINVCICCQLSVKYVYRSVEPLKENVLIFVSSPWYFMTFVLLILNWNQISPSETSSGKQNNIYLFVNVINCAFYSTLCSLKKIGDMT